MTGTVIISARVVVLQLFTRTNACRLEREVADNRRSYAIEFR